ncbi:non-LTR retroelement reverse transcriptase-like protein, partial [Striga asiatica]
MWDQSMEIMQINGNDFCLQIEARGPGLSDWCWLIFVYLSTDRDHREQQWEFLYDRKRTWGCCWAIAGDWNDIVSNEEKRRGLPRSEHSFFAFRECASDHNVLLFDTEVEIVTARKRFMFDSNWIKLEGISEAVEKGWLGDIEGSEMFKVHQR